MLPAVQFYNHSSLEIHEIDNVSSNRLLTAKLVAIDLAHAKVFP